MTQVRKTLEEARSAKEAVAKQYGEEKWFCGVGIVPYGGASYAVRITIDPSAAAQAKKIPKSKNGVRLTTLVMGRAKQQTR